MNSVFNLLLASCSFSFREDISESISSMKITAGCFCRASSNNALMSFSPSPKYLEVTDEAEIEKKTKPDSVATALASMVFPVPTEEEEE
jgi:hypothetical protein